jgi:long-chain fatty acid transport protein
MGAPVGAPGEASGSMIDGMIGMGIQPNWARFDFSDDSDFTGEADGDGIGGKLGMVYTPSPGFNIGLTYHSQIKFGDLETNGAKMSMDTGAPPNGIGIATLTGNMKVKDFKWPDMFGVGMSYQMNKEWMLAADIKYVRWSDALKNFSMTFTADSNPMNGPFGGSVLDATLYQDWDDIVVVSLGASLQATPELIVRGGMSFSQNPIPDETMNYLFPAIPKTHLSAGLGYMFNKQQSIDFAFVYAFEEEQTNPGGGYTTTHSQINWELMYSHRF